MIVQYDMSLRQRQCFMDGNILERERSPFSSECFAAASAISKYAAAGRMTIL
jgi:hypothetical protein